MPEGPELHLSGQFVNAICKGRIFAGKVRKNPIHKCADVEWDTPAYTISAESRGKELKIFLQSLKQDKDVKPTIENGAVASEECSSETLGILFNFGMSGKFEFTSLEEMPKHAHLSFFTKSEPCMALSFVDYRRFGKWQAGADWAVDRGPCVLFEYHQFRSHVLRKLADSTFNKPVCEVLLNQKYFNGIGNYLRAEICYRAGVRPFEQARTVLAALPDVPADIKVKIEDGEKEVTKIKAKADILQLCNVVALEVVGLGTSLYLPEDDHSDMSRFSRWLQCYYKPGMKNVTDHNKRTMWFDGDPGPLLPKESGARKRHALYDKKLKNSPKKTKKESVADTSNGTVTTATKKSRKTKQTTKKDPTTSPAKTRRATRTTLQTLPDKPASDKKSSKKAKPTEKKSKDNAISATFDDALNKSTSKTSLKKDRTKISKGVDKDHTGDGNSASRASAKGRERATRAAVSSTEAVEARAPR